MKNINKNCGSPGASLNFECDECDRKFTTKQGMNRHKTVTHKKVNEKKEEIMKRARSEQEKMDSSNKCEVCDYKCRSIWALKAHINHKHKEPTSPIEKKPKVSLESEMTRILCSEVVDDILGLVHSLVKGEDTEKRNKTTIEPTKDFLTNTAVTLAEMLDSIARPNR